MNDYLKSLMGYTSGDLLGGGDGTGMRAPTADMFGTAQGTGMSLPTSLGMDMGGGLMGNWGLPSAPTAPGGWGGTGMQMTGANQDFMKGLGKYGDGSGAGLGEGGGGLWDSIIGTNKQPGQLGNIVKGIGALGNAYLGMKQYGIAKDTLAFNKDQFNKNYDAQRKLTNSHLEDRQRNRIASNPGAFESVDEYMTKYGVN